MTEHVSRVENRPIQLPPNADAVATIIKSNIKPGAGASLVFNEGMLNIYRDRLGDWTISVALYTRSSLIGPMSKALENIDYFPATETGGKIYYIWTSAFHRIVEKRRHAEETLLETLKILESGEETRQYIS